MNTKEEILYKHSSNSITKHPNQIRTEILEAMSEYAKQRSIEFANFLEVEIGFKESLDDIYEKFLQSQKSSPQ